MKKGALYFLFIILFLQTQSAFCQAGVVAGKVVDAGNKPLSGAIVQIRNQDNLQMSVRSDNDGLYKIEIPEATSCFVDVVIDGGILRAGKIYFDPLPDMKIYYILKVANNRVEIIKMNQRAFSETNLRERRDIEPE